MEAMPDQDQRWLAVGEAIEARINALGVTRAEFLRKSGISDKTLVRYISGNPIVRKDKKRDLCRALGWTLDSIDLLLDGRPALPLPTEPHELGFQIEASRSAARLQDRADRHRVEINRLERRLSNLESIVERKFNLLLEAMGLEWDDLIDDDTEDPAAVTKGPGASLGELDELLDQLEGTISPDPQAAGSAEPDDQSSGQ